MGQTTTSFRWDRVGEEPQEIEQAETAVRSRRRRAESLGSLLKARKRLRGRWPRNGNGSGAS